MRQLLPSLFEEVFNTSCCGSSGLTISEDAQKIYVEAAIPGVKPEDVEATVDGQKRTLKIRGQSKNKRENAHYHVKSSDRFYYEIPLSNVVDVARPIEAQCKDGILTVELSKNRAPEPLKIDVKVA